MYQLFLWNFCSILILQGCKTVKVSRINLNTYNFVKNKILNDLSPYIILNFAHEVSNKIDFGDLDVFIQNISKFRF